MLFKDPMKTVSVPVMVDDCKDSDEFKMTRVAYYYIEAIEPLQEIPSIYNTISIPVLPLEFSGAILKPPDAEEFFETPEQIEKLFGMVEDTKSFYVDSDNLWIPNELFERIPERGGIYRIPYGLFIKLYLLCRNDSVLITEVSRLVEEPGSIKFSGIETDAFEKWGERILHEVITTYPKKELLKLSSKR